MSTAAQPAPSEQTSQTAAQRGPRRVTGVTLESSGNPARLTVRGEGLVPEMTFKLEPVGFHAVVPPAAVQVKGPTEATVTIPISLPPGHYRGLVTWPEHGPVLCAPSILHAPDPQCGQEFVYFNEGRATLEEPANDRPGLRATAAAAVCLASRRPAPLLVLGFASEEGQTAANLKLSQQRAAAVKEYLRSKLPNATIRSRGLGKAVPSRLGGAKDALAWNRRVLLLGAGSSACHSLRIHPGPEGLASEEDNLLRGGARCIVKEDIATTLILLKRSGQTDDPRAPMVLDAYRRAIAGAHGDESRHQALAMFASDDDMAELGAALGSTSMSLAQDAALVIPVTPPFGSSSRDAPPAIEACLSSEIEARVETPAREAEKRDAPPQSPPPAPPLRSLLPWHASARFGYLYTLDRMHLGGGFRIAYVPMWRDYLGALLGADLAVFGSDTPHRYTPEYTSNVDMTLRALGGLRLKPGPLNVDSVAAIGVVLPFSNAYSGDLELSLEYNLNSHFRAGVFGSVGILLLGGETVDVKERYGYGFSASWSFDID